MVSITIESRSVKGEEMSKNTKKVVQMTTNTFKPK